MPTSTGLNPPSRPDNFRLADIQELAGSAERNNSAKCGGWSTQRPANALHCGMIVSFVKPVAEPSSNASRVGFQTSGNRRRGLNDWGRPLFAFEFESITHSIGRIRVVSETSGPLRYRLPQPPWVHKMSAPAFCAESAVVPFISEPIVRRGHEWKRGRSAVGVKPEDVTLASDIADMEKVRRYFKLESVVLLGHSWGTVLALEYAVRYPQRVSRMILMNPAPASADDYKQLRKEWLETRPDDTVRRKAIAASAAYQEGDPDAVTAYYRIHFKPAFARTEDYEKFMHRLTASFNKEGILKARAVEDQLMKDTWSKPEYNLLPELKSLKIPTLVIYSDHDFIPAGSAEHITHAIPNARMVTLKNCGHFPYLECSDALREQIDAFFRAK